MSQSETDKRPSYVTGSAWEPSFWERGPLRYAMLSYSLWGRLIWKTHRAHRRKLKEARR